MTASLFLCCYRQIYYRTVLMSLSFMARAAFMIYHHTLVGTHQSNILQDGLYLCALFPIWSWSSVCTSISIFHVEFWLKKYLSLLKRWLWRKWIPSPLNVIKDAVRSLSVDVIAMWRVETPNAGKWNSVYWL